ncbi:MAG: hypothetical protein J5728_08005 [Lachnospiraceae bacterium]|nr:hypothetical protein [Lachnospiraceae bacterium]
MKKDFPLPFLRPVCERIVKLLKRFGVKDFPVKRESLERLDVNGDADEAQEEQACRTVAFMMIIAFAAILIAAAVRAGHAAVISEGRLARKGAGEGSSGYELEVVREGEEPEQITVNVSEQRYEGAELERFFEAAYLKLEKKVLAGNVSAEEVSERLDFVDGIEGTPIKVTWPDIDSTYFYKSGAIVSEAVTEPVIVSLTARLEYYDEVRLYSFPVRLVKKSEETGAAFVRKLNELLKKEDTESADSPWFNLPTAVEGEDIGWSEKDRDKCPWILLLGLGGIAAVIPAMRSDIAGKEKKREQEMMRDYPDIITKFVLLVTAGMTCRGAWEKICGDYADKAGRKRYAYEEMLRSAREMRFGVSEAKVYEDFGKRCGVPAYRKLGVLLANNLKRGSRDLTGVLEQEASEALEGRTAEVRRQAGEAGTKLLLPMFGMLCLVFAIIMVPAFLSFGG